MGAVAERLQCIFDLAEEKTYDSIEDVVDQAIDQFADRKVEVKVLRKLGTLLYNMNEFDLEGELREVLIEVAAVGGGIKLAVAAEMRNE